MEATAEPVSSAYAQVDHLSGIGDRVRDGAQWSCMVQGLVGSVLVVEVFVFAQGVA
ncbi:hypothetical protein [Nonomuraea typhae]|uniref:hypothetical protein n=1 Tax=Nonomuraea typhae TaxID=2603600 RepID=UPI0012FB5773|nr:hypothetical protein [Nonomuraea typhae]